jgi:hypothetical protein
MKVLRSWARATIEVFTGRIKKLDRGISKASAMAFREESDG